MGRDDANGASRTAFGAFPSTRWSLVIQAAAGTEQDATLALEEICRRYWYPIYAYARRLGRRREDAEDLTQGFFERLIRKDTLSFARQERGKLRTFLLAAFKRHLADESRRETAAKRGGGATMLALDYESADERFRIEIADEGADPEAAYQKAWAGEILAKARGEVRADYERAGKAAVFDGLEEFIAWNESNRSYRSAAEKLGINERNIRSNVYRLRQRFRVALESLVADTVESPAEVQAELQELLGAAG